MPTAALGPCDCGEGFYSDGGLVIDGGATTDGGAGLDGGPAADGGASLDGGPPAAGLPLVSTTHEGRQSNAASQQAVVSGDGRFVAFESDATNLVSGDGNAARDIFVRDTCVGTATACAPSTTRVSISTAGIELDVSTGAKNPSISDDGRFVAFETLATNLVAGDSNLRDDVFVRDTCAAASGCTPSITRVSVTAAGGQANNSSGQPSLSGDGRFVAFFSHATNLVPGDTNAHPDVFVRDTCLPDVAGCTPTTIRVSLEDAGAQADLGSAEPAITPDGRYVAFASRATNLVGADTNDLDDVFVRDTCVGDPGCTPNTTRASIPAGGGNPNGASTLPSISANGRFVAFQSSANNMVSGDTNAAVDIFLRDTCLGAGLGCTTSTTRVSVTSAGDQATGGDSVRPSISGSGRFVVFSSQATNLVPADTNGLADVFVRDTCTGAGVGCTPTTVRISGGSGGAQSAGGDSSAPRISRDGTRVVFHSGASNLVSGDVNGVLDVFLVEGGW